MNFCSLIFLKVLLAGYAILIILVQLLDLPFVAAFAFDTVAFLWALFCSTFYIYFLKTKSLMETTILERLLTLNLGSKVICAVFTYSVTALDFATSQCLETLKFPWFHYYVFGNRFAVVSEFSTFMFMSLTKVVLNIKPSLFVKLNEPIYANIAALMIALLQVVDISMRIYLHVANQCVDKVLGIMYQMETYRKGCGCSMETYKDVFKERCANKTGTNVSLDLGDEFLFDNEFDLSENFTTLQLDDEGLLLMNVTSNETFLFTNATLDAAEGSDNSKCFDLPTIRICLIVIIVAEFIKIGLGFWRLTKKYLKALHNHITQSVAATRHAATNGTGSSLLSRLNLRRKPDGTLRTVSNNIELNRRYEYKGEDMNTGSKQGTSKENSGGPVPVNYVEQDSSNQNSEKSCSEPKVLEIKVIEAADETKNESEDKNDDQKAIESEGTSNSLKEIVVNPKDLSPAEIENKNKGEDKVTSGGPPNDTGVRKQVTWSTNQLPVYRKVLAKSIKETIKTIIIRTSTSTILMSIALSIAISLTWFEENSAMGVLLLKRIGAYFFPILWLHVDDTVMEFLENKITALFSGQ